MGLCVMVAGADECRISVAVGSPACRRYLRAVAREKPARRHPRYLPAGRGALSSALWRGHQADGRPRVTDGLAPSLSGRRSCSTAPCSRSEPIALLLWPKNWSVHHGAAPAWRDVRLGLTI